MTDTRIVTTAYRSKRPPRKRKAVALQGPAIVRKAKPGNDTLPEAEHLPTAEKKPAIVATTSRKRTRLQRAEPAAEPDDPEADTAMRAWIERAKWGHGPAR